MNLKLASLIVLLPLASGLVTPAPPTSSVQRGSAIGSSRRAFVEAATLSIATVVSMPTTSLAYEFVDVGGGQGSAETKAMNIQAYETNNRLEKGGFKLDTPAEQSQSLSAALSEYSYEPTADKNKKNASSSKSGNKSSSPSSRK